MINKRLYSIFIGVFQVKLLLWRCKFQYIHNFLFKKEPKYLLKCSSTFSNNLTFFSCENFCFFLSFKERFHWIQNSRLSPLLKDISIFLMLSEEKLNEIIRIFSLHTRFLASLEISFNLNLLYLTTGIFWYLFGLRLPGPLAYCPSDVCFV